MRCPACNSNDTDVADSREVGNIPRRRRRCLACAHRWTTREVPDEAVPTPGLAVRLTALAQELEAVATYVRTTAAGVGRSAPAARRKRRRRVAPPSRERGLRRCQSCGALSWEDEDHVCQAREKAL